MTDPFKHRKTHVLAPYAAVAIGALALAGCGFAATEDEVVESPVEVEQPQPERTPEPTDVREPEDEPEPEPEQTQTQTPAPEEEPEPDPVVSDGGIEAYLEVAAATIPDRLEETDPMYSDIEVVVTDEHSIEFIHTFSTRVNPERVEMFMDVQAVLTEKELQDEIFPEMRSYSVPSPIAVTYTYLNDDGAELWTRTFSE